MRFRDIKLLSKDSFIYGIGNASNQIILIILAPVHAAYLIPALYGVRNLTSALYRVLQILVLMALDQAVIADYHKAKTDEERRTVVSTAFIFTLVTASVWGGLLLFSPTSLVEY